MKNILFFFTLFLPSMMLQAQEEKDSITVVFILKAPFRSIPSYLYKYTIVKNDEVEIKRLYKFSTLVYKTNDAGKYAMKIDKRNSIKIYPDERKVRFVKISSRMRWFHSKFRFREINQDEFTKLYNKKNWLRKSLKDDGYLTLGDIVSKM